MDLYEAVRRRGSVRAYRDESIEQDKLLRILEAGRLAPSARNLQSWKFIVVRGAPIRSRLAKASGQAFLAQAAAVIAVVSLDPDRLMHCGVPSGPVDCAIAIEHMALAATAEGLGTCWIGHFDQAGCCRILNVPSTARIIEMLTVGYPAAEPAPKDRKPLEEIVSYERFS